LAGTATASAGENEIGKFFATVANNNGVAEVVAPSINTDGLVIRTCTLTLGQANTGVNLFASPTAPASGNDPNTRIILGLFSATGGATNCPYPLHIPAGYGLWTGSSTTSGGLLITYDLLQ
jgi:hypothetical protein